MALVTEMVYLYPKENSEPHKTKNYEMVHHKENPVPVLRRGMKFTMAMRFQNRNFDKDTDIVRVFFNYGPNPNRMRDTQAVVRVDANRQNRTDEGQTYWFANVLNAGNETLTIEVFSRPNIPIGLWGIQVETTYRHSNEPPNIFDYEGDLYFICNPWNCHDLVYMPDTRLLDEYILTDVGKIWVGPVGSSRGREWIFGQFDECVLPTVWVMLEKSGVEYERRGDPIKLARIISKMVNSNDDDGIIEGAWHGQYEDGTAPSEWTGSVAILEQYLETQAPVKYGQCWVFAGVITTICRAIGIPSRVVSNLVSAHDANSTLTVDKYFDENNEEITMYPPDSIWNYHVWNDVYMARPDLPSGYGGWQAIDATPQETSDGFYQCGPASLEAVKNGQVGLLYDVGFILASVNADLFRWKKDDSSEWGYKKIFFNKYHIGKYILTKKPFLYDFNGDRDREDITCQYKAKEGSPAERVSLLNAVRSTGVAKRMYEMPETEMEDIFFDLKDIDKINIGEDFNIRVEINNKSDAPRNIKITLSAISVFYNGVKGKPIAKKETTVVIPAHETQTAELYVQADVYLDKLVEYSIMKINAIATVQETQQTWADEDDFQVIKPKFKFIVPDLVPVNETTFIRMTFKNPLKKYLTNCKVSISGPSLLKNLTIAHPDCKPEQVVEVSIGIKPTEVGDKKLVVTFSSRELSDISGSTEVSVSDPNGEE